MWLYLVQNAVQIGASNVYDGSFDEEKPESKVADDWVPVLVESYVSSRVSFEYPSTYAFSPTQWQIDQKHPVFCWERTSLLGVLALLLMDHLWMIWMIFIFNFLCNRHFGQESDSRYQELPAAQQKLQRGQSRWGLLRIDLLRLEFKHHPSRKRTRQWKITHFSRRYIFRWSVFHCHVSFERCRMYDSEICHFEYVSDSGSFRGW